MALIFADYWRVIRLLIAEDMFARKPASSAPAARLPREGFFYRSGLGWVLQKKLGLGWVG